MWRHKTYSCALSMFVQLCPLNTELLFCTIIVQLCILCSCQLVMRHTFQEEFCEGILKSAAKIQCLHSEWSSYLGVILELRSPSKQLFLPTEGKWDTNACEPRVTSSQRLPADGAELPGATERDCRREPWWEGSVCFSKNRTVECYECMTKECGHSVDKGQEWTCFIWDSPIDPSMHMHSNSSLVHYSLYTNTTPFSPFLCNPP